MNLILGLLLTAALGAQAAPSSGAKKAMEPSPHLVFADLFECVVPPDWSVERKPEGATLTGPAADGVSARIIVRYVPAGHALYDRPEIYMARLTKPSAIRMKGWKNGAVTKIPVAGRSALRLERDTSEFVPPESMNSKEVPVREEHLAVPAAKGFYLLIYAAPRAGDPALRPLFRKLVAGFKPKR